MPLTTDEVQQLHEALDRGEPIPWKFDEDGLRVFGRPRRLEEIKTDYGQATTLILEVDGRERSIIVTTVLENKLQRLDIQAGEPIGIERDAEKTHPLSGGTAYWDFRVKRIEATQPTQLNWGTKAELPEAVDAEVVEDSYQVRHLPRDDEAAGGF